MGCIHADPSESNVPHKDGIEKTVFFRLSISFGKSVFFVARQRAMMICAAVLWVHGECRPTYNLFKEGLQNLQIGHWNTTRVNGTTLAGDSIAVAVAKHAGLRHMAVGGDTTYNFLRRWPLVEPHVSEPFFVHIGLNDLRLGASCSCTTDQLERIRALDPRIVFLTVLHADVTASSACVNRKMRARHMPLVEWSQNMSNEMYRPDHIHPNIRGCQTLARALPSAADDTVL